MNNRTSTKRNSRTPSKYCSNNSIAQCAKVLDKYKTLGRFVLEQSYHKGLRCAMCLHTVNILATHCDNLISSYIFCSDNTFVHPKMSHQILQCHRKYANYAVDTKS